LRRDGKQFVFTRDGKTDHYADLDLVMHKLDIIEGKVPVGERPPPVAEQPTTAPSEKSPGDGKDDPAASDLSDEEKKEAEFKTWLDAVDEAQKASAHYLDEFTTFCRAHLPKITEEGHREKARALINKLISKTPAKPHVEDHGAATIQDVGSYSRAETDRLRSRVAELGTENRRLQIENVGLKNEVGELETVNSELRARIAELVEKSPASAPPPPITVS
jgi:hypothetical protein